MRQIKVHQKNESLKFFELTQQEIQKFQIQNIFYSFETIEQQKKINDFYEICCSQKKAYLRYIDSSYIIKEYDIESINQIVDDFESKESSDCKNDKQINFLFDLRDKLVQNQHTNTKNHQIILSTFDYLTFFYNSIIQRQLIVKQSQFDEFQNGKSKTFVFGKIESIIQNKKSFEKLKQIDDVAHLQLFFKAYTIQYLELQNLLEQFCQQQNLQSINLNISFNNFSQNELINLGEMIKQFKNLNQLKLILKQITLNNQQDIIASLFNKIAENINIQILDIQLEYNHLNQAQAQKICQEISRFPQLKKLRLDLDQNDLDSHCSIGLFETISQIKSLIELDISQEYNQINNDSFLSQKFQCIGNLNSLQVLNLSLGANFIQESAAYSIGEGVSKLQCLKKLSLKLQYLELQENGVITIFQGIKECINLECLQLDLQKNLIGQRSILQLCKTITELQKLISFDIDLGLIKIDFDDVLILSKAIKNHKKLAYFKFFITLQNQNQRLMTKRNMLKSLRLVYSKITLL
ncbi:hypothetical protein TTHERM_000575579 (macronuclear) [Tetrahymena thermophila SB210]|uniref:Kinase domain protein n=1 Tax=Tetrahymena thermophila (strain SB210) TaxID=312017 RepID=W7XFU4_TETTS|nr:hypothetical protein TTHERM_000575579 [Tetrahymena thermophila SB210]EWS75743.1 hypothetical protein TTHERM_000575579 [Tetrahymena thermophila SB210]|eukprot:XP_012651665.1 hypothetical protein TTHERM_000575579 [Tetrahymena thermophila SB210]